MENLFAGASSSESCGWGWARGPGDVRGGAGRADNRTREGNSTEGRRGGKSCFACEATTAGWRGFAGRGCARTESWLPPAYCEVHVPPLILRGGRGVSDARGCARGGRDPRGGDVWSARAHLQVDVRAQVEDLGQVRVLLDQAPLPRAVFLHALTKRVLLLVRPLRRGGRGVGVGRTEREARGVVGGVGCADRGCRRAYRGREGRSRARTLVLEAPIVLEGSSGRSDRRAASLARASRARQCRPRHHPPGATRRRVVGAAESLSATDISETIPIR